MQLVYTLERWKSSTAAPPIKGAWLGQIELAKMALNSNSRTKRFLASSHARSPRAPTNAYERINGKLQRLHTCSVLYMYV